MDRCSLLFPVLTLPDAPKKLLTEEEKEVLRGEDTVNAWGEEIIEMEIAAGAMYCPLKLLNVITQVLILS